MIRVLITTCIVLGCGSLARAEDRFMLPSLEARTQATKTIRDLFKAEFAKTTIAAKSELATKLMKHASETKDDAASLYCLLKEAAELGASGNIDLSLNAVDEIHRQFEGPFSDTIEPILKVMLSKVVKPDDSQALTAHLVKMANDSLASDRADEAAQLHKMAESSAAKSRTATIAKLLQNLKVDIESYQQALTRVATARETLKANPDDSQASLVMGKYLSFIKGDFSKGLPYLAKSSDDKLKQLAKKDLETEVDNALGQLAVADAWYDLIAADASLPKKHVQIRIQRFYSKNVAQATGLTRTRIEKRIEELSKIVDSNAEYPALWTSVRTAIRNKSYKKLEPQGGAFGEGDYDEMGPNGILIGFNYTLKKFFDKDLIDCFQPIYLTPSGEKLGVAHGNFKAAKMLTLKAKTGYAIGKMAVRGGGLLGGLNVHFMRIDSNGLKQTDHYESGWIGHKDAPDSPFLGDGRPIIGTFGKLQKVRDGGGICSIGLYLVDK